MAAGGGGGALLLLPAGRWLVAGGRPRGRERLAGASSPRGPVPSRPVPSCGERTGWEGKIWGTALLVPGVGVHRASGQTREVTWGAASS